MTTGTPDPAALRERLLRTLPATARDDVERLIRAAPGLYAVGGVVRDLLLDRQIVDVDLVTEEDAPALLRRALPSAKARVHARFGTASIVADGVRIDLATARRETYRRPGALPAVAPASIDDDLRRRDFSVNAIALRLDGLPALLDPCGGVDDVARRCIRVLHDRSFADDATRIFRAFRYAARLAFEIERHTAALLRDGIRYVPTIGGERLRRELELILLEPAAGAALEACARAGALRAVHPALSWTARKSRALAAPVGGVPPLPFGFALMTAGAPADEPEAAAVRLKLRRNEAAAVRGLAAMGTVTEMLRRKDVKPSGVVMLLDRYPPAAVAAFAATADDTIARRLALRYLDRWRYVKPQLSGRELQAMGVPAGPQIQRGLQLIRAAKLDGTARDRAGEAALALRFARSIRESAVMSAGIEFRTNGH